VRHAGGRTGVYEIAVTSQEGRTAARYRGKQYRMQGRIVEVSAGGAR